MTTEATAEQAQQSLIEEFEMFDNWMDRYQYIIDMGKALPAFPEEWKSDELKIQGCQSNVWMRHENRGDVIHFDAISDAAIVSGLIAVLMRIYSDRPRSEEHTSELQSRPHLVCRLLLEKKKHKNNTP